MNRPASRGMGREPRMGETTAEAQYRSRRNAPTGLETHAHNAQIGGKTATQQGGPAGLGTARGSSDHLRPALRGCRSPLPEGRRPLAETKEEEKTGSRRSTTSRMMWPRRRKSARGRQPRGKAKSNEKPRQHGLTGAFLQGSVIAKDGDFIAGNAGAKVKGTFLQWSSPLKKLQKLHKITLP